MARAKLVNQQTRSVRTGKQKFRYVELFRAEPSDRIKMIKAGLSAVEAKQILSALHLPQRETMRALRLSTATLNRKAAQQKTLAPEESERILGIANLVGQVESMVQESGNPDGFDAEKWVSRWLGEPVPALGHQRPIDLMDTMEGQSLVSATLRQMRTGAYA